MKVYCAGNITANDWRATLIAPADLERSPVLTWPIMSTAIPDVLYTGPYTHICGDACIGHVAEHITLEKTQRLQALWNADIVFVWTEPANRETLYIELGAARGANKRHIWIATYDTTIYPWLTYLATRQQFGATDPIAALTHMINNPVARKGFAFPKPSPFGNRDINGEL